MPTAVTTSAGVTVTVYRPGGIVAGTPSTYTGAGGFFYTDIPLAPGHGFLVNDRLIIGIDTNTYTVVTTVVGNTITALGSLTPTTGDLIVNLAADTGPSSPNYDGSDIAIYSTPDTSTLINESRVTTNEEGEYDYYHVGDENLWELVRGTDGAPVAIVVGAYEVQFDATNVKNFGAMGDGVTDDTVAIQTALDSFPSTGGNLLFPRGTYIITSTLRVGNGINIQGEGALATVIEAADSFTGTEMLLFQKQPASKFANDGIGMRYIRVNVNDVDTTGVRVYKGYDALTFDTVLVDRVGLTGRAYSFEPDPNDTGDGVSQTLLMSNCFGIHGPLASTGEVFYFKHMQEMTLLNCKGFGGQAAATGNCDVFHFDGCRGVSMFGGAAAISQGNGVRIRCSERESQGFVFYGVTFEAVGKAVLAGGDTLAASYITIDGSRYQLGLVHPNVTTGGFDFQNVTMGTVRTSPGFTLSVDALCNRINFYTVQLSHLISNAGAGTKVYADYDALIGLRHSIFGQSLAFLPDDTTAPGGPEIHWGHAQAGPNGNDAWRLFWSRSSVADFGYQLRYVNSAGTEKRVHVVDQQGGNHHLYVADAEILVLSSTGAAVTGGITTSANSTLGDASTDITTNVGRMVFRSIGVDPTSSATIGSIGEVAYSTSTAKFYGKHTTAVSDTNWRLLGT